MNTNYGTMGPNSESDIFYPKFKKIEITEETNSSHITIANTTSSYPNLGKNKYAYTAYYDNSSVANMEFSISGSDNVEIETINDTCYLTLLENYAEEELTLTAKYLVSSEHKYYSNSIVISDISYQ